MRSRIALTILASITVVSACIPVEINLNLALDADQTLVSTIPSPSPAASDATSPTLIPYMPDLTPDIPFPGGDPADKHRAVQAALSHLSGILDVPVEDITLLQAKTVIWRDASLGCPRPGRNYAQVITPGFRILLEHDGQRYELHSDRSGSSIVICDSPVGSERIPMRAKLSQDEILDKARSNLAQRLAVPAESITTVRVEEVVWEDPGMTCGLLPGKQPDRAYPRGIPGLQIVLEADGQTYEYHSGGFWLIFCGDQDSIPGP